MRVGNKHIFLKYFHCRMRLSYVAFVLLLILVIPVQSEPISDRNIIKNSTILLFDASNSMGDKSSLNDINTKMDNAKIAVKDFISGLDPASNEVALIVFYDCNKIVVMQPLTTNKSLISAKVDTIRPTGSTPLGAAIDFAKNYIDQNANGTKKKIIQFTDGEETCSYKATYNGSNDIEVSIIGFDIRKGSDQETKLMNFAKTVGGNYLNVDDASTPAALINSLRHAYMGVVIITSNLSYASVWNNKGKALASQKKYDEAIKAYDEAIKLDPNFAEAWFNKGNALNGQGKYEEAIKIFDEIIKLYPDFAMAWNNKGNAFATQGKYDEAIKAYDEAIKLDPNFAEAWNNKGSVFNGQGKYDEAIKAYDKAIEIDPKLATAWNNKGLALNAQGKYDEAIKAFDEAIRLDPTIQKS